MAPPKRDGDQVSNTSDVIAVKSADLLFMRDNFISGLSHLESGVHELKRAYITQFNTLLPEGHAGRLALPFFGQQPIPLGTAPGPAGVPAPVVPGAPQFTAEANTKKRRKPHDPNAPKRALTSYFLFMQHNKPQIKEEHQDWTAQQISDESEKRWSQISEKERADYEYMYQVDLARYYKQKECYERGEPVPEIDADEARRLYAEHLKKGVPFKGRKGKKVERAVNIPTEDQPMGESLEEDDDDDDEDESEEEEEQQAPPPKNKRQKTAPAPVEPPKSPEKKGKGKPGRKAKTEDAPVSQPEVASPAKPKKKKAGR